MRPCSVISVIPAVLQLLGPPTIIATTNKTVIFKPVCGSVAPHALFKALAMIETGNEPDKVGSYGERSIYQIMKNRWLEHCGHYNWSEHNTQNLAISTTVASKIIYQDVERFTKANGKGPQSWDIYIMWNAGWDYYRRKKFDFYKVQKRIRERAMRFHNLVEYYGSEN